MSTHIYTVGMYTYINDSNDDNLCIFLNFLIFFLNLQVLHFFSQFSSIPLRWRKVSERLCGVAACWVESLTVPFNRAFKFFYYYFSILYVACLSLFFFFPRFLLAQLMSTGNVCKLNLF